MTRLHGLLVVALSIAVSTAGVAACGAGRGVLGTNTSPCFLALPVARKAVDGRGSLTGVRLVDVNRLPPGEQALRKLLDQLPIPSSHEVCLAAFTGRYTPDQVEMPFGPVPTSGAGRFAIAVVTIPKAVLLGTFIVRREPLSFNREHVGF
jgi:hypothetical protein